MGGLLIKNIGTLCVTRSSIPFSRSVAISVSVTRQRRHLECLILLPEVVNATISQECIAKNASGVAMRMNKL